MPLYMKISENINETSIMLLKQPRPHFLPRSRQFAIKLASKDTATLCALRYIIKYRS